MLLLSIFFKHRDVLFSLGSLQMIYSIACLKKDEANSLACNFPSSLELAQIVCFKQINCKMLIFDWVATYLKKENFATRI